MRFFDPLHRQVPPAAGEVRPWPGRGFTLLELHVSVALLAIGFIALMTLMVRQSKQISRLEAWCVPDRTYYVVVQTDPWMRALGAPAELATSTGQSAWVPPVSGNKDNEVTLLSHSYEGQTMSAQVGLDPSGGG
jgi:prepilin-type N-terminal cleavage/methylation domain-containing protein